MKRESLRLVVAFPHAPPKFGGPGSFQSRLERTLREFGHTVVHAYDPADDHPDVIFVVGGTRKLLWLLFRKLRGAKCVHRLDGKNWHQSIRRDGLGLGTKAILTNWLIAGIKHLLADVVIYQSRFVADIWGEGNRLKPHSYIIHNGADLEEFKPVGKEEDRVGQIRVVCVEGTVQGTPAIHILRSIRDMAVDIYGNIAPEVQEAFERKPQANLTFHGPVERSSVPGKLSGSTIFLNLETNPACPNSVVEALSAGVPVVGFDSGSLKELVGEGGIVLPYGSGDPWHLDPPDCAVLPETLTQVAERYSELSRAARARAERMFSLEDMYANYLAVFQDCLAP